MCSVIRHNSTHLLLFYSKQQCSKPQSGTPQLQSKDMSARFRSSLPSELYSAELILTYTACMLAARTLLARHTSRPSNFGHRAQRSSPEPFYIQTLRSALQRLLGGIDHHPDHTILLLRYLSYLSLPANVVPQATTMTATARITSLSYSLFHSRPTMPLRIQNNHSKDSRESHHTCIPTFTPPILHICL